MFGRKRQDKIWSKVKIAFSGSRLICLPTFVKKKTAVPWVTYHVWKCHLWPSPQSASNGAISLQIPYAVKKRPVVRTSSFLAGGRPYFNIKMEMFSFAIMYFSPMNFENGVSIVRMYKQQGASLLTMTYYPREDCTCPRQSIHWMIFDWWFMRSFSRLTLKSISLLKGREHFTDTPQIA